MAVRCVILCVFLINTCNAVIYSLNDTEYERMPPLFALDAYEPCLRAADGIYCMVEFDLHGEPDNQLMNIIKEYSAHTVKHYNHTFIQRGVCVQKTCQNFIGDMQLNNTKVLTTTLEECFNNSIWNEYKLQATVKELNYCDRHDDVHSTDISDWVVVGVFIAIILVNIIGTCYDIFLNRVKKENDPSLGNQYLLNFSVLQNWQWLTTSNPTDPRIARLNGLNGYKTIGVFFMMIAHVMWVNSTGFTENSHDFEKAYESIHYQAIFNGMMIVQLFFVFSGFLMAYNLLIRSETQTIGWTAIPKILFLRWWRLTPAYAAVLAFTATWLRHCGSGPLWRLWVADSVAAECRRYWWLHLLYVQNYVAADKFCAIHAWYLGADMQVFALGLVALLAARARRLGLALLLLAGLAAPALHVWLQDLDAVVIMKPEFYRKNINKTFEVHIMGHNYLVCTAVGMATAGLLYRLQKKGVEKRSNKILQVLSWCVLPAMICLFLCGRGLYADAARAAAPTRAAWAAAHRLLMSGLVAFAIASLVLRFSESYCSVLEWRGWAAPGRLSYSVYLLHLNFVHILVGTRAYLAQVSFYNMIIVHLGIVTMSFMAAVPFYLLVEAPATSLMKTFLSRTCQHTFVKSNALDTHL